MRLVCNGEGTEMGQNRIFPALISFLFALFKRTLGHFAQETRKYLKIQRRNMNLFIRE
jgi:hypothetical protein